MITDSVFKGSIDYLSLGGVYYLRIDVDRRLRFSRACSWLLMVLRFQSSYLNDLEFAYLKSMKLGPRGRISHLSTQISIPVCLRFRVLISQGE